MKENVMTNHNIFDCKPDFTSQKVEAEILREVGRMYAGQEGPSIP